MNKQRARDFSDSLRITQVGRHKVRFELGQSGSCWLQDRKREVVLAFTASKVGTGKKRRGWDILNESPIMLAKSGQFSLLLTASSFLSWLCT